MNANQDRVLISFIVEQNGEQFCERLHAMPLGNNLYCLDNSPFYAYGVSFGDIVYASSVDGAVMYERTETRRGHSTYRVRLPAGRGHDAFLARWDDFQKLECTFEGSAANPSRIYSIDVPPQADVYAVYALLEAGEADGVWNFEEVNYCPGNKPDIQEH